MKKLKIAGWIVASLLVVGMAAHFFFHKKHAPVVVQTERPQYGYIAKSVTATGTIEPVDTVTVGSQVSGTIKKIYVDYNSVVRGGQLIAQLDTSLLAAQADQYRANLEMAKAQLVYQTSLYNRQTFLFQTGSISKQDDETAEYNYNAAKSNVLSVQAQLNAAEKNLSYCYIYSPINGVVLLRNISIGQTVAASFSTPVLFIIARDITKMQVQAAVDEADVGDVRVGQQVSFTVDAFPNDVFFGTVGQIRLEPQISANVVTYTTIVNAPNDSLKLKPGMTANIFISTNARRNALLISVAALKFKPDKTLAENYIVLPVSSGSPTPTGSAEGVQPESIEPAKVINRTDSVLPVNQTAYVWMKSGDTLKERQILTGITDDTHIEILEGLTLTDEVVLTGGAASAASATTAAPQASPFMPTRRSSTPVNKPPGSATPTTR